MIRVRIVDLFGIFVEDLKFEKVDALLEQVDIAKVLNVE